MLEGQTSGRKPPELPPRYLRLDAFWANRERWAIDGPGQVFLARAVDQLGLAKFGPSWIGVRYGGRPRPFPSADHRRFADRDQVLLAAELLRLHSPEVWAACGTQLAGGIETLKATTSGRTAAALARELAEAGFSHDQWDEAERVECDLILEGSDPKSQWEAVLTELHGHLLDGSLASYVRPLEGGISRPLNARYWNTEVWRSRFRTCRFNDEEPYAPTAVAADADEGSFVFIDKNGLDLLLKQQLGGPSDGTPLEYEPPFLALVIAACRQLRITRENPAEPEHIRAALDAIWNAHGADPKLLSAILKEKMVTILREPGAPKGSTNKKLKAQPANRPQGKLSRRNKV